MCHQNKLGHFAIHTAAFSGAREAMDIILKAGRTHTEVRFPNWVLIGFKSHPFSLGKEGKRTHLTVRYCTTTLNNSMFI